MPWEELGLEDYLEVVKEPMDLETVGEYLEHGEYEDDNGLVNPDWFWEDVQLCWDNCLVYYEGEEEVECVTMALNLQKFTETLEDEFWESLDNFEANLDTVDPALRSIAAAADSAANAVVGAAAQGGVLMQDLSAALYSVLGGWGGSAEAPPVPSATLPKKKKGFRLGPLSQRQDLLDCFHDLLQTHFYDTCDLDMALRDMEDIHDDLQDAFGFEKPEIKKAREEELQEDESLAESHALNYEGAREKRPISELLPPDFQRSLVSNSSKHGGESPMFMSSRPGSHLGASGNATPRGGGSRASSRRGSRSGRTSKRSDARGSRVTGGSRSAPSSEFGRRSSNRSGSSRGTLLSGSQVDSESEGDEPKVVKTLSRAQMVLAMPKRMGQRRASVQTTATAQTAAIVDSML